MPSSTEWIGVASTVTPKARKTEDRHVLRPPLYYCRMAARAWEGQTRLVLFDPADVRLNATHLNGWTPAHPERPFDRWERVKAPLPGSIYENVFVHLAMKGYSVPLRRMARLRKIPLFNPPMPDKWRILRLLQGKTVQAYVPETARLVDVDAALRKIARWRTTYVKPIGGYGGMGVTRIEMLDGESYRVSVDRTGHHVRTSRQVMSTAQLRAWIRSRLHRRHILQRGIPLLSVEGHRVDFRVVCQRGARGVWEVVGIVPKLAATDGVVSNIVAGGARASLEDLQARARRFGKEIPVESLELCALSIARLLSKHRSTTGIVGFDLGADDAGQVWLIEANPKPARSLLDDAQRRLSAQLSADFALYLAAKKPYN